MYTFEKTEYGFKFVFEGFIQADEMRAWYEEAVKNLVDVSENTKVMVDMRRMKTLPPDSKKILQEGQKLFASKGGIRAAIITSDAITKEQQRIMGTRSGSGKGEVYIDGSDPDWEQKAMNWLLHGILTE